MSPSIRAEAPSAGDPRPADLVLFTVNASYHHPSLALRCLQANLGPLRARAALIETDARGGAKEIVRRVLERRPRIAAGSVAIWNRRIMEEAVRILRAHRPDLHIVLGGPEIPRDPARRPVIEGADLLVAGEAELLFPSLCEALLRGEPVPPFTAADPPRLDRVAMPYELFTDEDLRTRTLTVEATRGCPMRCAYCASARDARIRRFPRDAFLRELETLIERGARRIKFLDRSFNLDRATAEGVLAFLLDRKEPDLQAQIELVPAPLPDSLRALLRAFPRGRLRIELGIQTLDDAINRRIDRRVSARRALDTLDFLTARTRADLHVDMIAGLPGDTEEGLAATFDALLAFRPKELQFGILKRLPGTPLDERADAWGLVFDSDPPYAIRQSDTLDAEAVRRLHTFSRFWEALFNRGRFPRSLPLFLAQGGSPFRAFQTLSDALEERVGRAWGVPLDRIAGALDEIGRTRFALPAAELNAALIDDYADGGRRRIPPSLRAFRSGSEQRSGPDTLRTGRTSPAGRPGD
jgi:radical SAM superfamily enzyme YgiQ (UPF0313 family)